MLRIKNQIQTIDECLSRLSDLVDEIVIVDNGSTDGTLDVYKKFPKIVSVEKTIGFDEGRDKILAHKLAKKRNPDWILWIDGDEVFEKSLTRKHLDEYMRKTKVDVVWFRLFHFWKSKKRFRIDGKWLFYTSQPQRVLWRNVPEAYFKNIKFHNGAILGLKGKQQISTYRLKHFGYLNSLQLKQKFQTYDKLRADPMAKKTMSHNDEGLRTIPFIEFTKLTWLERTLTDLCLRLYSLLRSLHQAI